MSDYQRIARIIAYLDEHRLEQPDLATLAAQVELSPAHVHRMFHKWAGITPKDFLQCLTLAHARALLRRGASVLATAHEVGLSGPSRLHDLCVTLEAASPGELKSGGAGFTIAAGFADSPFGTCLVGQSPRGVCHISFVADDRLGDRASATAEIAKNWPSAELSWNDDSARALAASLFRRDPPEGPARLRALVRGSAFQVRVWRALLTIPRGALHSYGQLAEAIGQPGSARAVGSAVGQNKLAYLIPCHRVIRGTGALGGYRWGMNRKRAMLAWETGASAV